MLGRAVPLRDAAGGIARFVLNITSLRTKVLEIGSSTDETSWVRGRQHTGRIVAISNKATFTEPVFNYSAAFGFIWEELTLPIAFDAGIEVASTTQDITVRRDVDGEES